MKLVSYIYIHLCRLKININNFRAYFDKQDYIAKMVFIDNFVGIIGLGAALIIILLIAALIIFVLIKKTK